MENAQVYHPDIDPAPDSSFWSRFGEVNRPIAASLLPFETAGTYPRYVAGKHEHFPCIVGICQLSDFISLSPDRGFAERRASAVDHEDLSDEEISFIKASFEEIILADVVAVTANYEFDVSASSYSFRFTSFIFPGDARFDLLRLLAPGNPDQLQRSELSALHAQLVYEAEEWAL